MEQHPGNMQQNPELVILNIREQMMAMGRNNSEWSAIDDILRKLRSGEYASPADAIAAAQNIMETKQDYN